jgi:prepilin-type N-terminal cleavage/methylation domain-containing protein/prepilin-type processing-associated H-X9-DG protein
MRRGFTLVELLVVMAILLLLGSITVPIVGGALEKGQGTQCRANLRAIGQAILLYTAQNEGRFPPALVSGGGVEQGWDFFIEGSGDTAKIEPGWIWRDYGADQILQCPSYRGSSNWRGEPHTGYNYNSSFLGGMRIEMRGRVVRDVPSANLTHVADPANTAMVGDGEYAQGANKFMRSPLPGNLDPDFSARDAGSQGFRHAGKTHAVMADGHVRSFPAPEPRSKTGFLGPDNRYYDLEAN